MQRTWRRLWEKNIRQRGGRKFAQFVTVGIIVASLSTAYGANSSDGSIYSGQGRINSSSNGLVITQNSNVMGIKWSDFSIGSNEAVVFVQPGTNSLAINRVIGTNPSNIFGTLSANGKIFLINPNGVLFAKGSSVNVAALGVSTSSAITDDEIIAGTIKSTGDLKSSIKNEGNISASDVALYGNLVNNTGVIQANTIRLVGNDIVLDSGSNTSAAGELDMKSDVNATGSGTVSINSNANVQAGKAVVYYNPVAYNDAQTKSDTTGNPYTSLIQTPNLTAYMLVNKATDLQNINNNLKGIYAVNQDILLTDEFTPLGVFAGTLDGEGYTIDGLKISSNDTSVGLFHQLNNAQINNLNFTNVLINGGSNSSYVGTLAGVALNSSINGVSVKSGSVTLQEDPTENSTGYVAGVVGKSASSSLTAAYNDATIKAYGAKRHAGGIVGMNYNGSLISNSVNDGSVSINAGGTELAGNYSSGYAYAGGIAAYNYYNSTVENSTNNGSVSGDAQNLDYVGGVVGSNWNGSTVTGSTNNGTVDGGQNLSSNIGGIVGGNGNLIESSEDSILAKGSSVLNSFNNGTVEGYGKWIGGIAGVNYNGSLIDGATNNGAVKGDGNSDIGGIVGYNQNSVIFNSSNLGNISDDFGKDSDSYLTNEKFENMILDKNVRMDSNQEVKGNVSGIYRNMGGIAGSSVGSTYIGDTNNGAINSVLSFSNVGGIVGLSKGDTISGASNTAPILGYTNSNIGGIVGFAYNNSLVDTATNFGTVGSFGAAAKGQNILYNDSSNVGGIAGWIYGGSGDMTTTVYSSQNFANMVRDNGWHIGGIAGQSTNGAVVNNSMNSGIIEAAGTRSYAGGITGANYDSFIEASTNMGAISNDKMYGYAGGITGTNWGGGSITGSINTGIISTLGDAASNAGGISGANGLESTISESLNFGDIFGGTGSSSRAGGIVGWNTSGSQVTDSLSTGSVVAGKGAKTGSSVGLSN